MAKLISKKKIAYRGQVHDLSVENTHSYNINSIAVHNSAAGSLVVYLLGITKVDPIEYGLLFTRFLNSGRSATPLILDHDMINKLETNNESTTTARSDFNPPEDIRSVDSCSMLGNSLASCLDHSHVAAYVGKHEH